MDYPKFELHISDEHLREHFSLSFNERELLVGLDGDAAVLGFAILLKSVQLLGYVPREKTIIPQDVIEWVAIQLKVRGSLFQQYGWGGRSWDRHLAAIRKYTGFRPCQSDDYSKVSSSLLEHASKLATRKQWCEAAVKKFREIKIELPVEKKFRRLVNSARKQFFNSLYDRVSEKIDPSIREMLDEFLRSSDTEKSQFDWMKSRPGKTGMKTVLREIEKLKFIKGFGIAANVHFLNMPDNLLKILADRTRSEDASQLRRHPEAIRYTLVSAFLHTRISELIDGIVKTFLDLARRIEKRANKSLEKDLVRDIKKVYGKRHILYKISVAATENPKGSIEKVLFSVVDKDVFERIIQEIEGQEIRYDHCQIQAMKKKYGGHYRRMMKPILDTLTFRANNPAYKPIIDGLTLVHKHIDTRQSHYPIDEKAPDGLLTGKWKELAVEDCPGEPRLVKQYFELCVLRKLERAIKCKEIWVENAYRYRNPNLDLPADWTKCRVEYCQKFDIPETAEGFIEPIKKEMTENLEVANQFLSKKSDVYIWYPGGGTRGLLRIPKIQKRPERPIIQEIKNSVQKKWGILNLIDILIEADRQVNFSRFFRTSAQRQVLSPEQTQIRSILSIYSLGTWTGLKQIHAASSPSCSYDDLLYFRKRFVNVSVIREAVVALTTRILEIRNQRIWGKASICASDGKYLSAWDQNLVSEFNPHYNRRGVMAYWHVERNSLCIYSQLRGTSEVAAMIEGLVRHDTEMRVEKNFVDSHGQSEVAFPFCRFLHVDLIPRLKRIKYERLYLPEKDMMGSLPNLKGILERAIRWKLVAEQYEQMVKSVVAVAERIGPTESILRRFNSYNTTNPVYKAFVEVGKALKTTHICRVLTSKALRVEINDALNVVENFNSLIDFLRLGKGLELQTNDPESMELMILCAHLLQNAIILVNTIMIERVFEEQNFLPRMEKEDHLALTPLFTSNINPFGYIQLNFDKPSFLYGAA